MRPVLTKDAEVALAREEMDGVQILPRLSEQRGHVHSLCRLRYALPSSASDPFLGLTTEPSCGPSSALVSRRCTLLARYLYGLAV
jgi:hypothetical protein